MTLRAIRSSKSHNLSRIFEYSTRRRAPEQSQPVAELLTKYESTPPRPLNLAELLSYGHPLSPESVLSSVTYALSELPRRMATRVRSLEGLPFIVGTNPYIVKVLNSFRESFTSLATYPHVTTLEENALFVQHLTGLVQRHANDIPTLAKGFQECSRYVSLKQVSDFLDGAIRNRISVRLIAEQHIAVSHALNHPNDPSAYTGIVDMNCSPKHMINICGSFVNDLCEANYGSSPAIVVDGFADAKFAYVSVHLEYVLTEILKNSFRATVEHHARLRTPTLPPVTITIAPPRGSPEIDSQTGSNYLSMRIRDQGGGVPRSNIARIFSYAFTTAGRGAQANFVDNDDGGPYAVQEFGGNATIGGSGNLGGNIFGEIAGKGLQAGMGTIAGLGYGLPMSHLYAKYFGGSLDFFSLDGWGSDVYLRLRCLDEAGDSKI